MSALFDMELKLPLLLRQKFGGEFQEITKNVVLLKNLKQRLNFVIQKTTHANFAKITSIIPPLQIRDTLISRFKKKANIFNTFFASQCIPLNNDSNVPYCQRCMTIANMSSIKFENKDIFTVIKPLDLCKALGYDDISIRIYIYLNINNLNIYIS